MPSTSILTQPSTRSFISSLRMERRCPTMPTSFISVLSRFYTMKTRACWLGLMSVSIPHPGIRVVHNIYVNIWLFFLFSCSPNRYRCNYISPMKNYWSYIFLTHRAPLELRAGATMLPTMLLTDSDSWYRQSSAQFCYWNAGLANTKLVWQTLWTMMPSDKIPSFRFLLPCRQTLPTRTQNITLRIFERLSRKQDVCDYRLCYLLRSLAY